MKRWPVLLWSSLALAIIGGAGYLARTTPAAGTRAETTPPATVAVTRGEVSQTISAPGELAASRVVSLGMEISGPLAEISVRPGEAVQAGQILARIGSLEATSTREPAALGLASENLQADLARAQLELLEAEQAGRDLQENFIAQKAAVLSQVADLNQQIRDAGYQLDHFSVPTGQKELAPLEAVATMYPQLEAARADFEPYKFRSRSDNQRAALKERLDQAQSDYDHAVRRLQLATALEEAQARLRQAMKDLAALEAGPDPDEAATAEARIAAAAASLEQAEAGLQALELRAPFAGVVVQVNARPGEFVNAGEGFLVLSDPQALEVQASIVEEAFPQAKAGLKAELYFDALPDLPLTGTLVRVVPQRLPGDRPLYPVSIQLDQIPAGLAPGMTVDAAILIEGRENVLRLPRPLLRAGSDDELEVRVWRDGREETRTIRLGLRGDLYVEILTGLQEGEEVIGP